MLKPFLDLLPHIQSVIETMVQSMLKNGWSKERIMNYLAEHLNAETYHEVIQKIADELSQLGG